MIYGLELKLIREITASDILGWLLAFIAGVIIFWLIDNMQTKLQRHSMISDIENAINEIFSKKIAIREQGGKNELVTLRTVLDDENPWCFIEGG